MTALRTLFALLFLAAAARSVAMPASPPEPALFETIARKDLKRVKKLVAAGADVYARDAAGRTPLVRATEVGAPGIAAYLLGLPKKPDLDARDLFGNAALHYAARRGDERLTQTLLAAGSDPRLYNRRCQAPLDVLAGFGFEALYAKLASQIGGRPLPRDGTLEECKLGDDAKVPAFKAAYIAFHRRQLIVRSLEDYPFAAESLDYIGRHAKDSAALVDALLALVKQPMPADALEDTAVDLSIRRGAVQTLNRVAATKAAHARVASELLAVVAAGGCSAFKARTCLRDRLAACKVDAHATESWPRDETAETCFNCLYCERAAVGHGFTAALDWFQTDTDHRAEALKALDNLRSKRLLPKTEHKRLRAKFR